MNFYFFSVAWKVAFDEETCTANHLILTNVCYTFMKKSQIFGNITHNELVFGYL